MQVFLYVCNMKVRFKNGNKILIMKISEKFKDGSVKLIDGSTLAKEEIIEYIKD